MSDQDSSPLLETPASDLPALAYVHLVLWGYRFGFRIRTNDGNRYVDSVETKVGLLTFRALVQAMREHRRVVLEITLWPWPPSGYGLKAQVKRCRYAAEFWLISLAKRWSSARLVVLDFYDIPVITLPSLLGIADVYYKRELPLNAHDLFLNRTTTPGTPDVYRRYGTKIKPLTLGLDLWRREQIAMAAAGEKEFDILWAGDATISTLRESGIQELARLQSAGLRVHRLEVKVGFAEFYSLVKRSWLVFAPEGRGWYTFRMYESLLCGSVPIVSAPKVIQQHPLIHGEHCLYYAPEAGSLSATVLAALADKARLISIAAQGRSYVQRWHGLELINYRAITEGPDGPSQG